MQIEWEDFGDYERSTNAAIYLYRTKNADKEVFTSTSSVYEFLYKQLREASD